MTSRVVVRATAANHYVLLHGDHEQPPVGPLAEYAARAELARLGFTSADIDHRIAGAVLA